MSQELFIEFGANGRQMDGWIGHDIEVPIEKPLPYADNTVSGIYSSHTIEHVSMQEALQFLDECRRILVPGGRIRVVIPVLERLTINHGRDIVFGHGHKGVYTAPTIYHMLRLAGFKDITETGREAIDVHDKQIGRDKDDLESARFEAFK